MVQLRNIAKRSGRVAFAVALSVFVCTSMLHGQTARTETATQMPLPNPAVQTPRPDVAALEQRADAEFAKRDCAAAEKSYMEAVALAETAGQGNRTGLYFRRIGICRARVGKLNEALDAYRHGMKVTEATGDIDLQAENVHGAALALQKLGRVDEALPLSQLEYQLAVKCGHKEHLVRAMWMEADLNESKGKYRYAMQLLEQALALSRTTTDHNGTMILLDNLAVRYSTLGDFDTALHMQAEILASETASTPRANLAIEYNNLGETQFRSGHLDQAWKSYEKAVELSTAPDAWRVHVGALLNVGDMRNRAGQTASSDEAFRQAIEITRNVKIPDFESIGLRMRSDALLRRGDTAGAVRDATEALAVARQLSSGLRTFEALLALGSARAAAGELTPAQVCFDEALQLAETMRAQNSGEAADLKGAFDNMLPLYQAAVKNLIGLQLPSEALRRAEQAKARVLMDILLRGGLDERAVMSAEELSQQETLRKKLAAANDAVSGNPTAANVTEVEGAMREYRQFRRLVYDNHPDLAVQSADFEAAGPDRIAKLLPSPRTALLDYFLVPSGVALFVVHQGTAAQPVIKAYILPDPKHTLAAEARAFREQLANRELGYKTAAQHLFQRLLAPAMAELRGTTEWIVSPDAALWDVPFEALVDGSGKHVIETRAIALTPSLTAALEIRQRNGGGKTSTGGIGLLAMGNPLPSSAALPDAAKEVREIAIHYARGNNVVLTGTAATATAFRDKAPSASVIHLAAHAGLNNSDPLSSFVRLGDGAGTKGDGILTALDIMSLHLRADMVVLSACETALGSTGPGEGLMGMGWALSAAGARSSVLSFWKVDSAASRSFMTLLHRHLTAGGGSVSRAAALRQTELEMMQSSAYRHPFYWAAFALWGDGSSR